MLVGVEGSHPSVETPYVSYTNSDGSSPNILVHGKQSVFVNPNYIASNLKKYYTEFIKNWYQ